MFAADNHACQARNDVIRLRFCDGGFLPCLNSVAACKSAGYRHEQLKILSYGLRL